MTRPESEYRYDPLNDQWVIVSSVRAERPDDFGPSSSVGNAVCPFCPGEERRTPPELATHRDAHGAWRIRVIPNKFPALAVSHQPGDSHQLVTAGIYTTQPGFGVHEVIVETPEHVSPIHRRPLVELEGLLRMYSERIRSLHANPRLAYACVFRNSGPAAGASLAHPHSQVIATGNVPPLLERALNASHAHYHTHGGCLLCAVTATELRDRSRWVYENDNCVAFCPHASRFPYQVLITTRRHYHDFSAIPDGELKSLAATLRTVVGRFDAKLDAPAYNWLIHTAPSPTQPLRSPAEDGVEEHYHASIELFPRQTRVAGFEWSTGLFINPVPPEVAARVLRQD